MANENIVTLHTDEDGRTILTVNGICVELVLSCNVLKASAFSSEELDHIQQSYIDLDF